MSFERYFSALYDIKSMPECPSPMIVEFQTFEEFTDARPSIPKVARTDEQLLFELPPVSYMLIASVKLL